MRRAVVAMQIKEAMDRRGMTRKQLADKMRKTPSEVTRWLGGNHNMTIDLLSEISAALQTQITGVIVDGYDDTALNDSAGSAAEYGRRYSIGPIDLPGECFHKLERKAVCHGQNLTTYIKGILVKEAVKPFAKAADFCGIWSDDDSSVSIEDLLADIKAHRTAHKEVKEL